MDTRADIELFIFLIKQEEKNDMQYKFIAKTELLISSKKESSNKLVWSGLLDKGVYVLIPSTTGCIFTKRKIQPSSDIHLTEIDDLTGKSKFCKSSIIRQMGNFTKYLLSTTKIIANCTIIIDNIL